MPVPIPPIPAPVTAAECAPTSEADRPDPLRSGHASGTLTGGGVWACFIVAAPQRAVYDLLADDARMSRWIPRLDRSDVLTPAGTGEPCSYVSFATGTPVGEVTWDLHRCHRYDPATALVWWGLAAGERFTRMSGAYWISPLPDGATLVRYRSEVAAAAPVPLSVQAEVARIGLGDLVAGIRGQL